jgi:NAD(P)-dependent dehydrogenase (short-subunit alcohol dehydrogenase family)
MGSLAGKSILVSGGGRGLGAAICRELAQAGAQVAVADVNGESARKLAEAIEAEGGRACALTLDVRRSESVRDAVAGVCERFGALDALVNNAGTDVTQSLENLTEEDWRRVLETNLDGPFLSCKHALPHLKAAKGSIVNICSTAARRCWPNASAYHASKWGLLGLSHALHAELRPAGVKVTALIAGGMKTPFLLDRFPDIDPDTLQDPSNVARTVRFVLEMPAESVIPEIMVLPMRETSWP